MSLYEYLSIILIKKYLRDTVVLEVDGGGRLGGLGKDDKLGTEQVQSIQFMSLEIKFVTFTIDLVELLFFAPY